VYETTIELIWNYHKADFWENLAIYSIYCMKWLQSWYEMTHQFTIWNDYRAHMKWLINSLHETTLELIWNDSSSYYMKRLMKWLIHLWVRLVKNLTFGYGSFHYSFHVVNWFMKWPIKSQIFYIFLTILASFHYSVHVVNWFMKWPIKSQIFDKKFDKSSDLALETTGWQRCIGRLKL